MTDTENSRHRHILQQIAHRVMLERGLKPDFPPEALAELEEIGEPLIEPGDSRRDLRDIIWCSIDNDDSRDLDQLTYAESLPDGSAKVLVAIADVDSVVKRGSAIDAHAGVNTTSVYTAAMIFPMLPEKLSTDITSLNFEEERPAVVVEMIVTGEGAIRESDVYEAIVFNTARLSYNSVSDWLAGNGPMPEGIADIDGLEENLRLQDRVAQNMKSLRHEHGALDFHSKEARPVFEGDKIRDLAVDEKNRAKDIVEDFMIAANGVTARFLSSRNYPSIRRVVRTPRRWERIVVLAAEQGFRLPETPDPKALNKFLESAKADDPLSFPDVSLSVIKLMGPGEYVIEHPGESQSGHFGLAVKNYTHSTAPNRRFPDLVTQRLLKAALAGRPVLYSMDELDAIAKHCTEAENAAKKVERQVEKSAAALLIESRIGEQYNGIVTGASGKGTWVRLFDIPVEGKLTAGYEGLDVGQRVRVELLRADVQRGFIDFRKV